MFTAQALKRYVTSNTHNPHCNSFHQAIWDISRLFTRFSCTTFPSSLRILHFLPLGVGKSAGRLPACRRLLFPLLHACNKGNRKRLRAGKRGGSLK